MGSERLRCAYCPYNTTHHENMKNHTITSHKAYMRCYGCLNKVFDNLYELKRHLKKEHLEDSRAWGCYDLVNTQQKRTFLYFGRDVHSGKSQQYVFVAKYEVNSCCG